MLELRQKQQQQQRLTPQQLQYLKLLQLSGVALEQRVKEELELNPLLEESLGTQESLDRDAQEQEGAEPESERPDEIDWDEVSGGEWESYGSNNRGERPDIAQAAEETFIDRLLTQLRISDMPDEDLVLAEELVGNLDADGYLRRPLDEIIGDLNHFLAESARLDIDARRRERSETNGSTFATYAPSFLHRPFGRDRMLAENREEPDVAPESPKDVPTDEPATDNTSPAPATRTIADLSLEEMAGLPIEELARILERGTEAPALAPGVVPETSNGENGVAVPIGDTFTIEDAERVLARIQRLDPPGIGARSLQENLAIQLDLVEEPTPDALLARRVINDAYRPFTMKHFEKICRRLDCTEEELRGAINFITTLNPKPGEGIGGLVETNYVTPEFVVVRDGEEYLIVPNDSFIPTLRINDGYRQMLADAKGKKKGAPGAVDRSTRTFLRQKMESAKWFIASIHQRRQTMLRVMETIVAMQLDFFRSGPDHLRPMIYRDVAERISMDISTVCRVVNGKYVQTDFGVFELRYFFSEALETAWGEEVSNKVVKSRIRELIAAEDKAKPLSDDAISQAMKESGYPVARRTVAKYREQMQIPIARLRREL